MSKDFLSHIRRFLVGGSFDKTLCDWTLEKFNCQHDASRRRKKKDVVGLSLTTTGAHASRTFGVGRLQSSPGRLPRLQMSRAGLAAGPRTR